MTDRDQRFARMRQVMNLERPDRLPCGDWATIEYRPDVYHLGDAEPLPDAGVVGSTRDGKRQTTRDGGVWATDAREKYRTPEDVLAVDLDQFEVEDVGCAMLDAMWQLADDKAETHVPVPMHYGTLVTRATIEFGWEPFLLAAALDPERFSAILDRFGEASLAVVSGWAQTEGVELMWVHDDIAATRGLILSPEYLRRWVYPWYERIFSAIHACGRKAVYMSDGYYVEALPDLLACGPDGFMIESSSMDPAEFCPRAGADKLFLIKTHNQNMDFGTPGDIEAELRKLGDLHEDFPGMMIYRGGGNPPPENARAFTELYEELLVY